MKVVHGVCILSQSCNALLRNGQHFIQTIALGQFMLRKNVLLFVNNLWCTENTLPAAWFSELLSECLTFRHKLDDFDEINASLFRNKEILNMHSIFRIGLQSSVFRFPFVWCLVIHPSSCFTTLFRQVLSDRDQICFSKHILD